VFCVQINIAVNFQFLVQRATSHILGLSYMWNIVACGGCHGVIFVENVATKS